MPRFAKWDPATNRPKAKFAAGFASSLRCPPLLSRRFGRGIIGSVELLEYRPHTKEGKSSLSRYDVPDDTTWYM
jgi:hypothetical protein